MMTPDDEARELQANLDRQRREEIKRLRDESDFKWLMADKRGRRIVHAMLAETGLYQTSFTGNSETFFREGARNVGLKLLAKVEALTPDNYIKMLQERTNDD
jgi:hypothetical protein